MPLHQADKGKPSMDSLSSNGKNSRLTILYLSIGLLSGIHHHVFPTEEWCLTNRGRTSYSSYYEQIFVWSLNIRLICTKMRKYDVTVFLMSAQYCFNVSQTKSLSYLYSPN